MAKAKRPTPAEAIGHNTRSSASWSSSEPKQSTREGTRAVAAHLPPEYRKTLKRLAADTDRSVQDLVAEALDDLFAKHGYR